MGLCVYSIKEATLENTFCGKLVKPKSMMFFNNGYLPDWFLIEVLSRLPLKCVFRYKCVSKRWRFLISEPCFASLYVSRASLCQAPWAILGNSLCVKGDGRVLAQSLLPKLDINNNKLHTRLSIVNFPSIVCSDEGSDHVRCNIVGVSDGGLVLFDRGTSVETSDYHVYNGVTGHCVALPRTSTHVGCASIGFLAKSDGRYEVVRLDCQYGETYVLKFKVFSSETGRWRSVVVHMDLGIEVAWLRNPVALDGKLHWIDRRHGILAFNPHVEFNQCRLIGLPGDIDEQCIDDRNNGSPVLLDVHHQGCLRYTEVSVKSVYPFGFSSISVWVLDEYDTSSWSLQHKVKIKELSFDDRLTSKVLNGIIPTPIAFHPFDANILYLGFGDTVASYNLKTLRLDALVDPADVRGSLKRTPCWSSAFLLTLPPWPISLPDINKETVSKC